MKPALRKIKSQPSWVIGNKSVRLAVTRRGGHMAPVTFYRDTRRPVRPYYVSPWQGEGLSIDEPVLRPLRGDFFCLPFGGNVRAYRGEQHVCHGETATGRWKLAGAGRGEGVTWIALKMKTKVRLGEVTKTLSLVRGQNVVYVRHVLEGFSGAMPLGHHATLAMPEQEGAVRVATSGIKFGMTCPVLFSDPAAGEYQSLAIGERFTRLTEVPLLWKDPPAADLTAFPARRGFCDLLAVFNKPGKRAWTTAVNSAERWMWFSLKDPAVLPATAMWISNHGRHGAPWNGRNVCLGLEDVCGYFAEGLGASARANLLTNAGVPTTVRLSRRQPTAVNYIEGVVKVPRGFERVAAARFSPGRVSFESTTGKSVTAAVRHEFLSSGEL
jgi:hypothetical protein